MNIYGRPGHREYRWMTELRDHHTKPHWESREQRADGSGLSAEWGWTQWLADDTEEQGIVKLTDAGFTIVRAELNA